MIIPKFALGDTALVTGDGAIEERREVVWLILDDVALARGPHFGII